MKKIFGFLIWFSVVTGVAGSPSHVGSPDPELEEAIEEELGAADGISLPEVQVVRFLGQRFPEMLGELERAEAAGPEKREEVLDRARGIIFEWEEHQRMGEQVAANFIEVERLHYQNDELVAVYVKLEEGAEKVEMGDRLRKNLTKVHDLRMEMERAELKRLKEEITAIEENLAYSSANRATMIETEMRDLLEYWRLEQAGETTGRRREEPFLPAIPEGTPHPAVAIPETVGTEPKKPGERVEVARPVDEDSGGGFVEKEEGGTKPEVVEEEKGEGGN